MGVLYGGAGGDATAIGKNDAKYGGYGGDGASAPTAKIYNSGTIRGGQGGSSTVGTAGGAGIAFSDTGGSITNYAGATITGGALRSGSLGHAGAGVLSAGTTLDNSGIIQGGVDAGANAQSTGGIGIVLFGSGLATNNAYANITGGYSKSGTAGVGAALSGGSSIANKANGAIAGGYGKSGMGGAGITGSDSTITNYAGATIFGGGSTKTSGAGVAASGSTIYNAGTISGGARVAGSGSLGTGDLGAGIVGSDLKILDAGAISGSKLGASTTYGEAITLTGGANTLALSASAGSSANINGAIDVKAGTLTFDQTAFAGAPLSALPADATIGLGVRIIGAGAVVKAGSGTLTIMSSNTYSGGTTISGGKLDLARAAVFTNGALFSSAAGTGAITFAGSSSELDVETVAQSVDGTFSNTLTSFNNAGDSIDLKGFSFNGQVAYTSDGTLLTVTGGVGGVQTQKFKLTNGVTAYTAQADSAGTGTLITAVSLCFASGTRIRTSRGDVAVDDLAVGDLALTAAGALRPIRWLGHRRLDAGGQPLLLDQRPVSVRRGAFGQDADGAPVPARELRLSPGHPVLVGADEDGSGGHLVPIMCLINGISIERVTVNEVTYWHVELEEHDILLAEGLPAESYIELGSRPWFAGATGEVHDPDMAAPGMPGRCRPVAIDGSVVENERRRLDLVFATRLAAACAWPTGDAPTFGWGINGCHP